MYLSPVRIVRLLIVLTFMTGSAAAAEFAYKPALRHIASTAGTLSGESLPVPEYFPPEESTVVGGNFVACSAYSGWGQKCYTYGTYYTASGDERTGCIAVTYAASCSCDTRTGATKGNCEYR